MAVSDSTRSRFAARRYLLAVIFLLLSVAVLGGLLNRWMTTATLVPPASEAGFEQRQRAVDEVFRDAVDRMRSGRYEQALSLWHQALLLDPESVEVKVNLGFTLIELDLYPQARDFFVAALEQNPYQANAYYGLAVVSEQTDDLEGALGAMRSFIHLAGPELDDRFIRRARAALWEWETRLAASKAGSERRAPAAK